MKFYSVVLNGKLEGFDIFSTDNYEEALNYYNQELKYYDENLLKNQEWYRESPCGISDSDENYIYTFSLVCLTKEDDEDVDELPEYDIMAESDYYYIKNF